MTSISFGEASVDIHALIIGIGIVQATGDVSLILWGYTKSSGRIVPSNALVPCFKYSCPIGQPFDRETIDREWPMERAALLKLAFAVSSFLDQRITTEERAHVERQARRRAERLDVEPVVHVVRFRKSEARTHNGDNSHDVEWSCQWLVRGHWRNQWHPRLQRHAPVWILPHIKGPADMPLKTPAPEVWQVAR